MAISASRFYGVSVAKIRKALARFQGIARRQEVRGEARGVKVIDDFGHHPTAIRETLRALRHRYPGCRLWAVFEPRSNTTRRAVFQQELPDALKLADGVFISQIARLEQIPEAERLNPEAVVAAIAASGRPAFYEPDVAHIVERLVPLLKAQDVVAIFSNGGFDGIHGKLLERLREAAPVAAVYDRRTKRWRQGAQSKIAPARESFRSGADLFCHGKRIEPPFDSCGPRDSSRFPGIRQARRGSRCVCRRVCFDAGSHSSFCRSGSGYDTDDMGKIVEEFFVENVAKSECPRAALAERFLRSCAAQRRFLQSEMGVRS